MKKLILAVFVLAFSSAVNASSDFTVAWQIGGQNDISQIRVDLNLGNEFVSANGAIVLDSGAFVPITGTCFLTLQGGIQCNFHIGQGDSGILEIGPTLNGDWRVINVNGFIMYSAPAFLLEAI